MWNLSNISKALKYSSLAGLSLAIAGCGGAGGDDEIIIEQTLPAQWTLVFEDNFDGSTLNSDYWNVMIGDGTDYGLPPGWGNNEQQWYTSENVTVADGNLVITAKNEPMGGMPYTSGRINTANKVDITYGRIEARIKMPTGQGIWGAFWALPTDSQYGGWASGGEIDVMEVVNPGTNDGADEILGTIHFGQPWPLNQLDGGEHEVPSVTDYHTYAVEWEANEIRWYVDDVHYHTATTDTWYSYFYKNQSEGYVSEPTAPFNQNFHLLLNMAIGGNLPGAVSPDTVFPAQMMIDHVRVFTCEANGNPRGCDTQISYTVDEPKTNEIDVASYTIFDGDNPSKIEWLGIIEEPLERELAIGVAWDNEGAISASQVDNGGNQVFDIMTTGGGNVAINAVDGERFSLFGMGNSQLPWELHAGEIKFDLYIDSASTPDEGNILIKMDSGWPALGQKVLSVASLEKDAWQSISVPINDIIATPGSAPLDMDNVLNLFVIEFDNAAHVMIDNVSIKCGHPTSCGITPPYTGPVISTTVDVFIDEVNLAVWDNGMGAWDDAAGVDYFDGATGNHVNWSVVDAGGDHGNVIAVDFKADGANGVFYIQSSTGVDLSALANTGTLTFDVRSTTGDAQLTYKVDCIFPCSTGDQDLGVVGSDWTTFEIPVSQLIDLGLNIEAVNTGLVIFPTWGNQQGISIEVDNISWKGDDVIPPPPSEDVVVFDDAVNTGFWTNGVGAWDTTAGVDYYQGDTGNHVTWEIVDSGEAGHGNVLAVDFSSSGADGVFYIQSAEGKDLTALSDGAITFDIRTTEGEHQFTYKFDCIFPCTTGDQDLGMINTEWSTHVISVAEMIELGLNIEAVNTGLVIFPTWGNQQGISFELDNIHWLQNADGGGSDGGGDDGGGDDGGGDNSGDGTPLMLYQDSVAADWELWNCCSGAAFGEVDDGGEHGMVAEFTFDGAPTVVGFQTTPDSGISHNANITGGQLVFEVKVVSQPNDTSGTWTLKVESVGAATFVELPLASSNEGVAPETGVWQTFTFDLANFATAGLDLTQIDKVMVFPTWGTADGATYRIDNVEFKAP